MDSGQGHAFKYDDSLSNQSVTSIRGKTMPEISGISLQDKFYISIDNLMESQDLFKVLKTWHQAMKIYVTQDGYKRIGRASWDFRFVKVIDTRDNRKWLVK